MIEVLAGERHGVSVGDGHVVLVLHRPSSPAAPCVVACHGLGASKDSDKYLLLAAALPRAGIALARFDFRGSGESTGLREDETTVGTRVADARGVLAFLAGHAGLSGRFGLFGSSMGGFVALHVAHERADGMPVVTWNSPATLAGLADAERREAVGLGAAFAREHASGRYAHAPAGVGNHLTIHGDADETVPVGQGTLLHAQARPPRGLVVIPGGDHRLTDPGHRRDALARSLAWFQTAFRP